MAEEKKTSPKAEKSKDSKKKSKKNPFKSIVSFFKSVKAEGKKVVWSPAKDVVRNTIIVIIVVTIVGAAIYGVDTLLSLGMKQIKNAADKENTTASEQGEETSKNALEQALEDAEKEAGDADTSESAE